MKSENVGAGLVPAREYKIRFTNFERGEQLVIELEENKRKILQIKSKLESIGYSL